MSWHQTVVSGRLSKNPELKYLSSGTAVCDLSIPVTERWRDKNDEWQEKTIWYDVSVWGKRAEWCNQYLRKGSVVVVVGNMEARGWIGKDGEVKTGMTLKARQVTPLSDWGNNDNQGGRSTKVQADAPKYTNPSPASIDDIPF